MTNNRIHYNVMQPFLGTPSRNMPSVDNTFSEILLLNVQIEANFH